MPQIAIICGQIANPNPDYGCGVILDSSNRSKHSSGLCRPCDSVKQRLQRKARKEGRPTAPPSPSPAPVKGRKAYGCGCPPDQCALGDNLASAPLRLVWSCRIAPERVTTLQRFTQAQRQAIQVEREGRELDGGYLDIAETAGQWDIAEQRIARLYQFHQANLPPEWWEICAAEWDDFLVFWNSVTPVRHNRNAGPPEDARPVYRGPADP